MSARFTPRPQPVQPSVGQHTASNERLEGWKEIAAYLLRDVRTAKRWEHTRNLPVHRLPGGPKPAVYATRTELELWRQGAGLETSAGEGPRSGKVWWLGSVAAGVALAAIVGWLLFREPPRNPPRLAPLTSYRGVEWFPAISPDGRSVAFSWNGERQDNFDLYLKGIHAGSPVRLTADPEMDFAPAWSPDGRYLAFLRWRIGAPTYQYLVLPALGGQERVVATGRIAATAIAIPFPAFSWTPDGSHLIVSEPEESSESYALKSIPVGVGEIGRLTEPPQTSRGDCCPVVSPDGRMVAFLRASADSQREPFVLAIEPDGKPSGTPRRLDGPACVNPVWSGDGTEVLCIAGDRVDRTLWRIPVRGGRGQPQEVPPAYGLLGEHLASRGHMLVYSNYSWEQEIWERREGAGNTYRRLIASTGDTSAPDISPDGKRIVFVSTRSGHLAVWIAVRDGTQPIELAPAATPQTPRWSPTGDVIAYTCRSGGGPEQICTIGPNGGPPRPFTRDQSRHLLPSWSRDGKWLYYASDASGSFQTWRAAVDASVAPIQVTRNGGYGGIESADGRTLFYAKRPVSGPIHRVPVLGGNEVALGEGVASLRLPMNFAVGPEAVIFAWSANPSQSFELRSYGIHSGQTSTIQRVERGLGNGMALAPDGRSLLFTTMELSSGDLFLVDNFH